MHEHKPNYIVRNRYFVWGRQLSYLLIVLLLLWKLTQIRVLTLDPIYICALLFSIGYNGEPDDPQHMRWLLFDLSQLLYGCILLFKVTELGLGFNVIIFCLSVIGCFSAILNVIFKPSYYVHSEPTDEYTCTLFSCLSFSYINECLIVPACRLASFELDFLPSLMDCDTSSLVWRRFQRIYELGADVGDDPWDADEVGLLSSADSGGPRRDRKTFADLVAALYLLFQRDIWLSLLFSCLSTCAFFVTPLSVQRIMFYLSHYDPSTGAEDVNASRSGMLLGDLDVYSAVALMCLCPIVGGTSFSGSI